MIQGQCDHDITNKLDTMDKYNEVVKNRDLVGVLEVLRDLCMTNDDQGRSFCLMKAITTTVNLLNIEMGQNELATKFQERLKMEYLSVKAVSGTFPIGTAALTSILEDKNKNYAGYCKLSETDQKEWERKAD